MIVEYKGYTVDLCGRSHISSSRSLHYLKIVAARRKHPIIILEEHHYMNNDYDEVVEIGVVYFVFTRTPDNVTPSGHNYRNVMNIMTRSLFPVIFRM